MLLWYFSSDVPEVTDVPEVFFHLNDMFMQFWKYVVSDQIVTKQGDRVVLSEMRTVSSLHCTQTQSQELSNECSKRS